MQGFCHQNRLNKAALTAVAHRLGPGDIGNLGEIFAKADKNTDGLVTYEDLIAAIRRVGAADSAESIAKLAADMDTSRNGYINYTEFLAAAMDKRHYQEESVIWEVFQ